MQLSLNTSPFCFSGLIAVSALQKTGGELPPFGEELILSHVLLLKPIAQMLVAKVFGQVDPDDLLEAGMSGLIEAARSYQPNSEVNVSVWIKHHIRRAMLEYCGEIASQP